MRNVIVDSGPKYLRHCTCSLPVARLEAPTITKNKLNRMLHFAARRGDRSAVEQERAVVEVKVRVARFDPQRAGFPRIELDDAAQIENEIRRPRVNIRSARAFVSYRGDRLRVALKSGPSLSEKTEMIPPDPPFQTESTLQNRAA